MEEDEILKSRRLHYMWDKTTGEITQTDDFMEWASWMETADRSVAKTPVGPGIVVSTVFLGLDHRMPLPMEKRDRPVLFETMVFGGKMDQNMMRASTYEEACVCHMTMVAKAVKSAH